MIHVTICGDVTYGKSERLKMQKKMQEQVDKANHWIESVDGLPCEVVWGTYGSEQIIEKPYYNHIANKLGISGYKTHHTIEGPNTLKCTLILRAGKKTYAYQFGVSALLLVTSPESCYYQSERAYDEVLELFKEENLLEMPE